MDGSGFGKFPVGPLIWLAAFGILCAVLIAAFGIGAAAWWIFTHVQIV